MANWALFSGCLWLVFGETAAGSWSDYEAAPANSACRGESDLSDAGRDQSRHAVTHLSTVEQCREFCDSIRPCWGLEFADNNDAETNYGNCEVWFTEIKAFKSSGATDFKCYRKNASSSTDRPDVFGGWTIGNVNVTKIMGDSAFLGTMGSSLIPMFEAHLNASIVQLKSKPDVRPNVTAGSIFVRFTFQSSVLHPAELHNAVRILAMNGNKHHGTWGNVMVAHSPDVMTETQQWFANQTAYITGTPSVTADYLTLAPLAPALPPLPAPPGGGSPGGGSSTTGKSVADAAMQSARPFFLFFFSFLAFMM